MQVIEVPDNTPTATLVRSQIDEDAPTVVEYQPAQVVTDDARVLAVVPPLSGAAGANPTVIQSILDQLQGLDGRLDLLESNPPSTVPSGPAGGDLDGYYPSPVLRQQYATTTALTTQVGTRARRTTVRAVSTATTANVAELLLVDATSTQVNIAPPLNPEPGDVFTLIKTDASANLVVLNAAVASDASAEIVGRWNGAVFVYTGSIWLVQAVNVAYSAAPTAEGGTGTGLTREQADARYEPIGAANFALSQVSKETVGLANVANLSPANLPISTAAQAALDLKADKTTVRQTTAGGTVTLNAALGSQQAVIMTSNVTLAPPTNPTDQQSMRIEVFSQPGADRTVTILSAISNASGQTFPFTVRSARFGIVGLIYSARAERWLVTSYVVEPG